jgi:putative FmdB family regulatory protein
MPTYEYECKKCGRFDLFQRITEERLERCPKCKGKVKRLLGAGAGIIFKGSGFYQTDYRSEGYKSKARAESTSASPSPSTPSTPSTTPAPASPASSGDKKAKG